MELGWDQGSRWAVGEGRGSHTQGGPLTAGDSARMGTALQENGRSEGNRAPISLLPLGPGEDPSGVLGLNLCPLRCPPDLPALGLWEKSKSKMGLVPREAVRGWEGFPRSEGLTHSKHTTGDGKHLQGVGGLEGSVASIFLVSSDLARLLGSQA